MPLQRTESTSAAVSVRFPPAPSHQRPANYHVRRTLFEWIIFYLFFFVLVDIFGTLTASICSNACFFIQGKRGSHRMRRTQPRRDTRSTTGTFIRPQQQQQQQRAIEHSNIPSNHCIYLAFQKK